MLDPYKVLNVPYDVTAAELQARYREFAKKLHGDAGGSDELMKLINEANEQIRLDIKNGTESSPEPDFLDGEEWNPAPSEEEHPLGDDADSGGEDAYAAGEAPPIDPPEDATGSGPQWEPDARILDIDTGSYATSPETYPNRLQRGTPWRLWAGSGTAAAVLLVFALSGANPPATPPAPLPPPHPSTPPAPPALLALPALPPPLPPPRPRIAGYLHLAELATGFTINPGQTFGFDLPMGRTEIAVASGMVALETVDGETDRSCSGRQFFVDVAANSPATKTRFVSACGGEPSILKAAIPEPVPTPKPPRPPTADWTPAPAPPTAPNIANVIGNFQAMNVGEVLTIPPGGTFGVQVVNGRTAFRILSGAIAASQASGRLALACTSSPFIWMTAHPKFPASFYAVSCNGLPAVVQVSNIAISRPTVNWRSIANPGFFAPMQ